MIFIAIIPKWHGRDIQWALWGIPKKALDNYMNEQAASTIASGFIHSAAQEIIIELVA